MEKYFNHKKFHLYLIGILIAISYVASIGNGLSLDDDFVVNEETKKGFSNVGHLITSNYYTVDEGSFDYRPVVMVSFAIEYGIFGENYGISHLINLLIYFFVCLAVFKYLSLLFGDQKFIIYASLILFVVHPLHSEVVLSLKNRDELFAALFGFHALNLFLKIDDFKLRSIPKWGLVFVLFYLSFLSKKTGLSFVGIAILSQLFLSNNKLTLKKSLLFILPLFIYKFTTRVVTSVKFARDFKYFENPLYSEPLSFVERIPLASDILVQYVQLFFIPHPLRFYYGHAQITFESWSSLMGIISFLGIVALLAYGIYAWRKRQAIGFGIVFFLSTGMLYSNLLKPAVGIMAERFVFVPILGLCISLAYLIYWLIQKYPAKKIINWTLLPITIIFAILNMQRSGDWESRISLYEADIAHLENSAKANFLYAHELQSNQDVIKTTEVNKRIEKHYSQALAVYPEYKEAANNLGWLYVQVFKQGPPAFKWFKHAVKLDSTYSEALYGLGYYYRGMNQLDSAVIYLSKAYQYNKKAMLGTAKLSEMTIYGQQKNAKALIEKGKELLDDGFDFAQTYNFIGNGHYYNNNIDSALHYFDKGFQKEPTNQQGVHIYKMAAHYSKPDYLKKYGRFANLQQVRP